jgi:4-alpha-glucanotransferase
MICASTHDLPTLQGWWSGRDIEWRQKLGLVGEEEVARQWSERAHDRELLLEALAEQGLKPEHARADGPVDEALIVAIHRFIADSPCRLLGVQLDDTVGATEQANVPATIDTHPNWRRKTPCALEDLDNNQLFQAVTGAVAAIRPRL